MVEFRRVVVTGGAGFIGSNYVRHALEAHPEWTIVVFDKLTYAGNLDNLEGLGERVAFIEGDIADAPAVAAAVEEADAIVNFAAETHVDRSLLDAEPFVASNVLGVMVLLEAVRKSGARYLQVSTDEVYGDLAGTDTHSVETDVFKPRSPYAATKAAAEHLVSSYVISYGVNAVTTRGSNTYGPWQYPEKIIPVFVTNAIDDRPLPLYGRGEAVRDYMHAEDHAAGVDRALHEGVAGEAYNLGADIEVSGVAVAEGILDALGKPRDLIRFVPDRPGHDYRYSVDSSRAVALGWQRKWNWSEGLVETVRWYVEHEAWWRKVKEKLEFRRHEKNWYEDRE